MLLVKQYCPSTGQPQDISWTITCTYCMLYITYRRAMVQWRVSTHSCYASL